MNDESRPKAAPEVLAGGLNYSDSTGDEPKAAIFFRDSYAVLVRGKSVRRHLYFNLPAAERCVGRALARGDHAEMILVRLVPVDARYLEEPRELRRDPAVDERLRGLDD